MLGGGFGEPLRWRAAPGRMPAGWAETSDVVGEQAERARAAELRYISRRRAEPEAAEQLARRAFQDPHPVQATVAAEREGRSRNRPARAHALRHSPPRGKTDSRERSRDSSRNPPS